MRKKSQVKLWLRRIGLVLITLFILFLAFVYVFNQCDVSKRGESIIVVNSNSIDSVITVSDSLVLPVIYKEIPDLKKLHYKDRMVKFIDLLLPSVLLAQEKMKLKRQKIISTQNVIDKHLGTNEDSVFIKQIMEEYKVESVEEILERLHPHPVSIILAQAAIESGWATSRFCHEANNVFGIWSFDVNEDRIKASATRGGRNVYLRKYNSVFESIYDYLETIARVNAYEQFRKARILSDDPFRLIWYLNNYSERRYEYVRSLRNMIEYNKLYKYDNFQLADIRKSDKNYQELLEF